MALLNSKRSLMAAVGVSAALVLFGTYLAWSYYQQQTAPSSASDAARIENSVVTELRLSRLLTKDGGKAFSLRETQEAERLRGKVVIVNFWASWCGPCAEEFPSLLQLADKLKDKMALIAISIDSSRNDVMGFLKIFDGHRPNLEVLIDSTSKVAHAFGTRQIPETYVLDKNRRIVKKIIGSADWTASEHVDFVTKLSEAP